MIVVSRRVESAATIKVPKPVRATLTSSSCMIWLIATSLPKRSLRCALSSVVSCLRHLKSFLLLPFSTAAISLLIASTTALSWSCAPAGCATFGREYGREYGREHGREYGREGRREYSHSDLAMLLNWRSADLGERQRLGEEESAVRRVRTAQ